MTTSAISSSTPSQVPSRKMQLKSEDFIKMMITQLQNQDPLEPAKNQELLAQMSQIGQLQSNSQLSEFMQTQSLQQRIGAAGNLIGRTVRGLDASGEQVEGIVTSVRVEKDQVFLELDNGNRVELGNVSTISTPEGQAAPAAIAA